jgi:hypothetical protein
MNTLTWYAKGGVERPVVTCESHRLEEYHRQVKHGREIAGTERGVADECDVCKTLRDAAKALREARPAVVPGSNAIANTKQRMEWYATVNAALERLEVSARDVPTFCDLAGVPS